MAWILLNIHRATEAMGRAAVFYSVTTLLHSHSQASILSAASMLYPDTQLPLLLVMRTENEDGAWGMEELEIRLFHILQNSLFQFPSQCKTNLLNVHLSAPP